MELANCNCFMWQTVIIQAKEGKRERVWVGWRKNNRGTWPPHTAIRAVLGCDERWQLALLWADTVPFFGPQGATSAAQTLSLQLPWPPESPPPAGWAVIAFCRCFPLGLVARPVALHTVLWLHTAIGWRTELSPAPTVREQNFTLSLCSLCAGKRFQTIRGSHHQTEKGRQLSRVYGRVACLIYHPCKGEGLKIKGFVMN